MSAVAPNPSSTASITDLLLEQIPAMLWQCNAEGVCVGTNHAWAEFAGPGFDAAGDWTPLVHPDDVPLRAECLRGCVQERKPFSAKIRLRYHDGGFRSVIFRGQPHFASDGSFAGCVGLCMEADTGKAEGGTEIDAEGQVQLLSAATGDIIWCWDAREDRVYHNELFARILGPVPTTMREGVDWWKSRVHPDDRERSLESFAKALTGGVPNVIYEYRFQRLDGAYAMLEERICFIRDQGDKLIRILATVRDISERHEAQRALERFARILEATSDFVTMVDRQGYLFYLNRGARSLLGLKGSETGEIRHMSELHPEWAFEIIRHEGIPTAIRDGIWSGETALLDREGREVPVSEVIISHPSETGEVEFVSTIARDISDRKREEVARIEWANRYDAAIRASGQILFDWNSSTNEIKYAGDIQRVLGYTAEELSGGLDQFRKIVLEEDLPAFDSEIQRVSATREPFQLGFRVCHKNGGTVCVDAKGYFFLDRRGHYGHMVGFIVDVTAQKRAEEELARAHDNLEVRVAERTAELERATAVIEQRARQQEAVAELGSRALAGAALETLFEDVTEIVRTTLNVDICAVLELTPDRQFLNTRQVSGWPADEILNRIPVGTSMSGYTLLHGEPVILRDAEAETRFAIPNELIEENVRSGVCVVIQAGKEPIGVLSVFSRGTRAFTRDDVHFLESVANVLTAAINRQRAEENVRRAREQAEIADRAKGEFLSRMSHELRTPLNAILGFTQLLEVENPTPSQMESIGHISRAGRHLLAMINEVLDMTRIEAGRLTLTPEPIEVNEFLHEVVDANRQLAAQHQIELHADELVQQNCYVIADRHRLRQVVFNLISNGIKFNRTNGRVHLRAEVLNDRVRISVSDTGVGIPADKLERLFVPFERLGAERTDVDGTGIGLALSQRIVAALHGHLGVETVVGEGSTFWVDLPMASDPTPVVLQPPSDEPTEVAQRPATILYIEDEELNVRLVQRILASRKEYHLLTAMDGLSALQIVREHLPDVVLLDLNLPDMPGERVLLKLKEDSMLRGIPVIMVSAEALGSRINELLALGADGYLTKPYRVEEFLRVIDEALKKPDP